ncbi:MAG: hypothetical protein Q8M39_01660 [Sulfuricurvum sp.]|nr:hypothetical protein [Sulfuricurvum sp.]
MNWLRIVFLGLLKKRLEMLTNYIVWIEIVGWTTAFTLFGYLLRPTDPFFFTGRYDVFLIFMTVFTLFYGTVVGIIMLGISYVVSLNFYTNIPYMQIMQYLIFVLIYGEFHYHWNRKINIANENNLYTKNRLRMLGNAFFLAKISHDQLEKTYIMKPMSLREAIVSLADEPKEDRLTLLLERLSHYYGVENAAYYHFEGESAIKLAEIGNSTIVYDKSHPMLDKMLSSLESIYVSDIETHDRDSWLAVLPSFNYLNELRGVLILKKMPFMMFNIDNILKIEVILNYFEQEENQHIDFHVPQTYRVCKDDFLFELMRLLKLNHSYGVQSSLFAIHATKPASIGMLDHFLLNSLRVLDLFERIEISSDECYYVFLLPFENISGTLSFEKRILNKVHLSDDDNLQSMVVGIDAANRLFDWISTSSQSRS